MSTYNVKDFGAIGDGQSNDTAALQEAIDKCNKNAGGEVVVPPGVYRISTLHMKSNVELHLMAGSTPPDP